ncbi:SCO family protein [Alphaproteobacteria bacterium]|nr:SCO family protein [Alphaproteobacteria bacterium]
MSPRVYLCIAIFCVLGALGLTVSEFVANKFMPATTFDVGAKFSLINHQGAPVTESVFQGHPSALFFGFTHCPEVCPTTLNDLALAKQELGPNDKLKVYFITLDPLRDTSDVLAEYIPYFGPDFMGITGSEADIQALSKSWGIYSQRSELSDGGYNIDHTATVFLLDSKGQFAGTIAYGEAQDITVKKLENLSKK